MQKAKFSLLGAVASVALLAGGLAHAQTRTAHGQVIEVPPGSVVLVLPGGAMRAIPMAAMPMTPGFDTGFPVDMIQQMRQMDQMMAEAQRAFAAPAWTDPQRMIEAAIHGMPQPGGNVQGVVVTSYFDGQHSCTRRVTYSGNGAAPKVEVSASGGCGAGIAAPAPSVPAATPYIAPSQPALPHTLLVRNRSRGPVAAPVQLADAH